MAASTTLAKAKALASTSQTWARGRSKRTGASFYVIPASDGRSAHYSTADGCTCTGFMHRGRCSHVEAVFEQ